MPYELTVLINIFYGFASFCGLLFLYFRMRDAFQQKKDREATQQWYEKAWLAMDLFGIKQLPQKVIRWVIDKEKRLMDGLEERSDKIFNFILDHENDFLFPILIIIYSLISFLCMYFLHGLEWWIIIYAFLALILSCLILVDGFVNRLDMSDYPLLDGFGKYSVVVLFVIGLWSILEFITKINVLVGAFSLVFLIPVIGWVIKAIIRLILVSLEDEFLINDSESYMLLETFGFAASISFSITMFALFTGSKVAPDSSIPQTAQLLILNVLFDGFTLVATLSLLKWSIKEKPEIRIPIAIIGDVLIAALFACCSLYFGLLKSEFSLTFMETVNILIARSPAGNTWDLGPYFWAMHTTFIPTLLYLFFILLTLIGKYFTLPFMKLIKGASGAEKPHYATATTFGFIGAVFAASAKFLEWCYL